MRIKEIMRRSCAVTAVAALVAYHVGPAFNAGAAELTTREENVNAAKESKPDSALQRQGKQEKGKKDYIVKFKTKTAMKQSTKTYEESTEINQNGEDKLEENKLASLELSGSEAKQLETNQNVEFVEEDKEVSACGEKYFAGKDKKKHKKVEKRHKKNESDVEWNVRMIHAENKTKKQQGAKKVKIAILDSGVDWGNDINLAGTVSLVPGEEDMSPLFIDGTGHGNSVAGLIAAKDNGKGITGINTNADVYSIRVLDDDNCAPVSRVIEAIYLAIEKKVNIINMSFGMSTYSKALEEAINMAVSKNILIVAAAGNKGKCGVLYPAAFENVIAVGSVDKNGEIAKTSSQGKEVDIVAPGELVRSTGELGDQLVSSGTSLAAPHVSAAASIIWEKDMNMSANFVRDILINTSNLYGEKAQYGYGLLDIEYALKKYKEIKEQYNEKDTVLIADNHKKVDCFDNTGCLKGSWSENDHDSMVPSENKNVKKGARFPDKDSNCKKLSNNPWWHGSYRQNNNYVKAYICATMIANNLGKDKGADVKFDFDKKSEMVKDVNSIKWDSANAYGTAKLTPGKKRALVWGMALHTLSDTFAHSVYIYDREKGRYRHLDHPKPINDNPDNGWADDTRQISKRWADACRAVDKSMEKYNAKVDGTYKEFDVVRASNIEYYLRDLADNIWEIDKSVYLSYVSFSYTYSNSTK